MILSPSIRSSVFPPVPEKATQVQALSAKEESVPHVHAPPVNEGEAEEEAADLVNGITTSIQQDALGIPTDADPLEPDIALAPSAADDLQNGKPKKTSPAIGITLRVLSDITDLCERFSNLLHPSPPFTLIGPRLQLVGVLLSIFLLSSMVSSHVIVKSCSLAIGLAFFGDPVFKRAMDLLNTKIPNWKTYMDIEK
ncbi:uncharacterized protein DSM5745_00352 [Aspergillus mulundensis]|uniref:Uncharacterized protein n=1 Tax=Aspergillus mulundensis TaxID=1810919 RepID=A0A3D8T3B9_9EURO|nr:hypothetical protein DSM5745_00352 [Aspergillus mulundensis]RDW93030.1 hypothetical protein DSM5745_00352 [Aspergillus mulundensis]